MKSEQRHPILADPALAADLAEGCGEWDRGRFWHAHEAWEQCWHRYRGGDRDRLKGLIQAAAVQHHVQRGRIGAAMALLVRLDRHLGRYDARNWPIDEALLLAACSAQAARVSAGLSVSPLRIRLLPQLRPDLPETELAPSD